MIGEVFEPFLRLAKSLLEIPDDRKPRSHCPTASPPETSYGVDESIVQRKVWRGHGLASSLSSSFTGDSPFSVFLYWPFPGKIAGRDLAEKVSLQGEMPPLAEKASPIRFPPRPARAGQSADGWCLPASLRAVYPKKMK